MKKDLLDYVVEKTHEMMEAHSCSADAKAAGQAWLDAVGTENEAQETEKYIAELEADANRQSDRIRRVRGRCKSLR